MNTLDALMQRLQAIVRRHPGGILRLLGEVGDLPLLMLDLPSKSPRPLKICLSSGIHGDEPAGVEAHLRFLEALPPGIALTSFPCMNPRAFLEGTRTADGLDLNRLFHSPASASPNRLFEQAVKDGHWDLFLDLHEDYESEGFYLLEVATPFPSLGREIQRALVGSMILEPAGSLLAMLEREGGYPLMQVEDGRVLVEREGDGRDLPQAPFMARYHADQSLTFETPSQRPFEERVQMHLRALDALIHALWAQPARR